MKIQLLEFFQWFKIKRNIRHYKSEYGNQVGKADSTEKIQVK